VTVLLKEPQPPGRAPRGSSPASVRRRPSAPVSPAEEILELQRTAGNQASVRAIARRQLTKPRPPAAQVPDPENLPEGPTARLLHKDGAYKDAQGIAPEGSALSSGTGTPVGEYAGKLHHSAPAIEAGAGTDIAGYGVSGLADIFTLFGKGGELHGNRKDSRYAKDSGSRFWRNAASRQERIKGTDVGVAATKLVSYDLDKIADYGVVLAENAGHVSAHGAAVASGVTGFVALPITTLNALRDTRKLIKQGARLDRMRKRLHGHDTSVNVQEAQRLKSGFDQQVTLAEADAAEHGVTLRALSRRITAYDETRDRLLDQARQEGPEQWREISARIRQANRSRDQAENELTAARAELGRLQTIVTQAQAAKRQADEDYKPMAAAVTDMAGEVRRLSQGQQPSLKTIAYYAKVKSAKGVTRRTVKVIAGGLGVAAGVCALVALLAGPGAAVVGPIGVALGATGAALGLGLAISTGWSYLSKRWGMTDGAYLDTGEKETDQESGAERPVYRRIEGRLARLQATFSYRAKLYSEPGADGKARERKTHRKLMAEALWDYATDERHPAPVRNEAWAIIKDLTGRTEEEFVSRLPRPRVGAGNAAGAGTAAPAAPNGATEKVVLKGQRAAALKLFEDKLKSA
jgi:hypothetical protein